MNKPAMDIVEHVFWQTQALIFVWYMLKSETAGTHGTLYAQLSQICQTVLQCLYQFTPPPPAMYSSNCSMVLNYISWMNNDIEHIYFF